MRSATWLAQAGSHFFSEWQLPILFSGGLAEISMQISLIWKECDLACASRVALWGLRLRGSPKCRKMKVLRMRCSIVENRRASSDSVFITSRGLQLPYRKETSKNIFFNFRGQFLDFALYGSWEPTHSFKMMSQGVGTFSTIENLIPRTSFVRSFLTPAGNPPPRLAGQAGVSYERSLNFGRIGPSSNPLATQQVGKGGWTRALLLKENRQGHSNRKIREKSDFRDFR